MMEDAHSTIGASATLVRQSDEEPSGLTQVQPQLSLKLDFLRRPLRLDGDVRVLRASELQIPRHESDPTEPDRRRNE